MKIDVTMPKFGLNMEEGLIESWTVKIGQKVAKGDELAEVSTDKITNSVQSPEDGYVRVFMAEEGDSIACGETIAVLTKNADDPLEEDVPACADDAVKSDGDVQTPATPMPAVSAVSESSAAPLDGEVKITPRAKKIAEAKGLAYGHIKGTGLLGMITVADLKRYGRPLSEQPSAPEAKAAAQAVPAPAAEVGRKDVPVEAVYAPAAGLEVRKLSALEKTTARAMHGSLAGSAQATIATEADVSKLVDVYRELKPKYAKAGVKLSITAMLIKALAMALEDHPKLRARMVDAEHVGYSAEISIGVAVDLPDDNLIVPVIRNANLLDLRSIALKLAELAEKARAGKLAIDDLGGATMTISNMGTMGITYFTPVLNPPEGALLGVGAIRDQVVAEDGAIRISPVMYFSLTHDHRIINGGPAARFLRQFVESLSSFGWF